MALSRQERAPPFLEGIPCRRVDSSASASFAGALEDLNAFVHLAVLVRAVDPREFYRANRDDPDGLNILKTARGDCRCRRSAVPWLCPYA